MDGQIDGLIPPYSLCPDSDGLVDGDRQARDEGTLCTRVPGFVSRKPQRVFFADVVQDRNAPAAGGRPLEPRSGGKTEPLPDRFSPRLRIGKNQDIDRCVRGCRAQSIERGEHVLERDRKPIAQGAVGQCGAQAHAGCFDQNSRASLIGPGFFGEDDR